MLSQTDSKIVVLHFDYTTIAGASLREFFCSARRRIIRASDPGYIGHDLCSVQLCITERVRSIVKQSRRGVYNPFSQGNTSGGMQTRELLEMVVTIGRLSSRRKKVREF